MEMSDVRVKANIRITFPFKANVKTRLVILATFGARVEKTLKSDRYFQAMAN